MRKVQYLSFPTTGAEATLSSGTANVEYEISFFDSVNAGVKNIDDVGQVTVTGYTQCSSGTATVTISYKNLYGSGSLQSEGSYFAFTAISATTSKQFFEFQVHVLNPDELNTDATGCKIKIARPDSVDLLHLGRVIKG